MMDNQINTLTDLAQDGYRITFTPAGETKAKTLWAGMGNRAGLHSFAYTLLREKWEKSGARFEKKLATITGGEITVHAFRNTTRDRGRWVAVRKFTV
jgi:hypothetical protein